MHAGQLADARGWGPRADACGSDMLADARDWVQLADARVSKVCFI